MTDIPNQVQWRKVFQNLPSDLKAEITLAALSEIIVKQATAGNLNATVTLAALSEIIVKQATAANLKAEVSLAALSEIIVKQATAANLNALVTLAGLQGIIPNPITATRVNARNSTFQIQTSIIYTVPAGQKLYISSNWISFANTVVEDQLAAFYVRNNADVLQYYIQNLILHTIGSITGSLSHFVALEAAAGWDVCVQTFGLGTGADAGIHGWLESV